MPPASESLAKQFGLGSHNYVFDAHGSSRIQYRLTIFLNGAGNFLEGGQFFLVLATRKKAMAVKPLFFFPKRVNVLGQRLVSFQIFLVSLWILVFGETASKIPGKSGEWCVVPHTPGLRTCRGFVPLPPMLPAVVCMQPSCGGLAVRAACLHASSPTIASRAYELYDLLFAWVYWGAHRAVVVGCLRLVWVGRCG
jgi:hypothetical protein